jgi:methionyl-tRNA formyltransferase
MELAAPAIKTEALAAGVPVLQPEEIGSIAADLAALFPDVIVVMAYGQILRKNILTLARTAIVNLHASLLPKYRGAACIQAAIDAGDAETGVTAMHVVRQLDAGDMIFAKSIPISPDETGGSLHDRLGVVAAAVLAETLEKLAAGAAPRVPQNDAAASYIAKLDRGHGEIDWTGDAVALERRIRAYDPWPGTFTTLSDGGKRKRLKIFPPTAAIDLPLPPGEISQHDGGMVIGCGAGSLRVESVQPEGGRRMSGIDWLRGRRVESS